MVHQARTTLEEGVDSLSRAQGELRS
jgi:hypothetical protein